MCRGGASIRKHCKNCGFDTWWTHGSSCRFWPGKVNWCFAPTECEFFLGGGIWPGAGFRKQRKTLCFQPTAFKFKKEMAHISNFEKTRNPICQGRRQGRRCQFRRQGGRQDHRRRRCHSWGGVPVRCKNCIAEPKASEVIVKIAVCRHSGSCHFWPGEVNWCFAPTECEFFLGGELWPGGPLQKTLKNLMFSAHLI